MYPEMAFLPSQRTIFNIFSLSDSNLDIFFAGDGSTGNGEPKIYFHGVKKMRNDFRQTNLVHRFDRGEIILENLAVFGHILQFLLRHSCLNQIADLEIQT